MGEAAAGDGYLQREQAWCLLHINARQGEPGVSVGSPGEYQVMVEPFAADGNARLG